ncbi:MAG: hypothetical protein FJW31_19365 [Acidobacteria bacterium]|nr:hypothetical protein [Acidobacteriota bacterium]
MEDWVTHKSTTILISTGSGQLAKFRSLHEVPAKLRERLWQSTAGPYSATLLIADEAGRHEILRSLRPADGAPAALTGKSLGLSAGSVQERLSRKPADTALPPAGSSRWRHTAELALLGGIGLCLWLLASWR